MRVEGWVRAANHSTGGARQDSALETALSSFAAAARCSQVVVVPHIRPAIAQLAFLHVSQDFRAAGVGSRLSADLELVARRAGDTEIVVSATPSENTVRF
jgi:predicted N-acetyltransferase YhbS